MTDAVTRASIADLVEIAGNTALLGQLQEELGRRFEALRGTIAHRVMSEGTNPALAWNVLRANADRAARERRLSSYGPVEGRQLLDRVITTTTDVPAGIQAFESYWNVDVGAAEGQTWNLITLRTIHAQCKVLPEHDVRHHSFNRLTLIADHSGSMSGAEMKTGGIADGQTNEDGKWRYGVGTRLSGAVHAGKPEIPVLDAAVFTVGATVSIGHGQPNAEVGVVRAVSGKSITLDAALTNAHSLWERITPNDQTATADVAWLPAVIRHEIAHSVDSELGDLVSRGFCRGLGEFESHLTFDDWAAKMGDPWHTDNGQVISEHEKDQIKTLIDRARQNPADYNGSLLNGLDSTHPIYRYWEYKVPVIDAAQTCLSAGKDYWQSPELMIRRGNHRFAINLYYKEFHCYNEQVHAQRVSDYAIFSPAEFFAEVYTVFYEQAGSVPDAQLGARVPVASWRDWIRTNIHNRGWGPAAPHPAAATPPTGAPASDGAVAQRGVFRSPSVGKAAMNSGHG
jgi:hypothetical protein